MQALISPSPRLTYAAVITGFLLVLWLIPPASVWFRAFVKLDPMRIPYTVMFFSLLFCLLIGLWHTACKKSFPVIVAIGAISGQLMAVISILTANLFIPDGIERTVKTIQEEGLIEVLLTDFAVALILGGWLIGAIASAGLKLAASRSALGGGVK